MTALEPRSRQPKQLDAGIFQAEISSFALRLAAEGKAAKTSRTCWEEVDGQDVQHWIVRLLGRYSGAYASNQYRALQQFFKWLAAEEDLPDPMAGLRPPEGHQQARPGLHQPGAVAAGTGLRRPRLHAAPRHRDRRGAHGERNPAI